MPGAKSESAVQHLMTQLRQQEAELHSKKVKTLRCRDKSSICLPQSCGVVPELIKKLSVI